MDITGIAAGTLVLMLDGALPVEYLTPGDSIITRNGMRKLRSVTVHVVRDITAIRIAPSALGHGRPDEALLVTPDQGILIRDWRARAMFGADQITVTAARLVDGTLVRAGPVAELRLFSLVFDAEEVVYAGALETTCPPEPVTA